MDASLPTKWIRCRGSTPLHFAACAKKNTRAACELLLEHDADTDAVDMQGAVAYEKADDDEIRKLLGGPDARCGTACMQGPHAPCGAVCTCRAVLCIWPALFCVCRIFELAAAGKADELKALLASGEIPSVRVNDPDGTPPVIRAIMGESLETVKVGRA